MYKIDRGGGAKNRLIGRTRQKSFSGKLPSILYQLKPLKLYFYGKMKSLNRARAEK